MKRLLTSVFLFSLAIGCTTSRSAGPFAGTWKLNPTKSQFTGETMRYTQTGAGEMQWSGSGFSYNFKIDGKEYPALFGYTAEWSKGKDGVWTVLNRLNGKLLGTDTLTIGDDGQTLTVVSKGTKPNGEAFEDTAVYERLIGDRDLAGTWRNKEVKISAPGVLQISPLDSDGIIFNAVEYKQTCSAKFDGKDYPFTGPTMPEGITVSLQRTSERVFEMVYKEKGKPIYKGTFTVSQDGKTLTEVSTAVAVNEPVTAVFERQ